MGFLEGEVGKAPHLFAARDSLHLLGEVDL